jgi:hypothetical protein
MEGSVMVSGRDLKPMKTRKLCSPTGIGLWPFTALFALVALTNICHASTNPPLNTVVATVMVGALPGSLVCSPDNKFVYVVISGGIAVIKTATNQLAATYSLPGEQTFLAISPDGQTLYASEIANTGNGVQVITRCDRCIDRSYSFPFSDRVNRDSGRDSAVGVQFDQRSYHGWHLCCEHFNYATVRSHSADEHGSEHRTI